MRRLIADQRRGGIEGGQGVDQRVGTGWRHRAQHDVAAHPSHVDRRSFEAELLRQPNGLAAACCENFGGLLHGRTFFNDIAHGKYSADEIRWRIPSEITDFTEGADNLMFISNHDENSWNGSEIERLGPALEALAVLIFTIPGMPMLYSGMEAGNNRRLSFFDKDCIEWKPDKIAGLYTKLAYLRMRNLAMWSLQSKGDFKLLTTDHDDKILCFKRESGLDEILVVLNLSAEKIDFSLTGQGYQGSYKDVITEMHVIMGDRPCFALEPWGFRLFEK